MKSLLTLTLALAFATGLAAQTIPAAVPPPAAGTCTLISYTPPNGQAQTTCSAELTALTSSPYINLKLNCGAKGDGTTNDYAAITACLGSTGAHLEIAAGPLLPRSRAARYDPRSRAREARARRGAARAHRKRGRMESHPKDP